MKEKKIINTVTIIIPKQKFEENPNKRLDLSDDIVAIIKGNIFAKKVIDNQDGTVNLILEVKTTEDPVVNKAEVFKEL